MANLLNRVAQILYTPAVAAIPATPAYCTVTYKQQVVQSSSGWSYGRGVGKAGTASRTNTPIQPEVNTGIQVTLPAGIIGNGNPSSDPEYGYGWIQNSLNVLSSSSSAYSTYSPYTLQWVVDTTVCFPEVAGSPAIPARTEYINNFGWNAGARSLDPIPDSGLFRCSVPESPMGVQVGILNAPFNHEYSDLSHSLVVRGNELEVVESGFSVFGPVALSGASEMEVSRISGVVTYRLNDVVIYQSEVPSVGTAYAAALLYSLDDFVDAPKIEALDASQSFNARTPRILINTTAGLNIVQAVVGLPFLNARLNVIDGLVRQNTPSVIAAISTDLGARIQLKVPSWEIIAKAGRPEAIPTHLLSAVPPPVLSALVFVVETVDFSQEIPAVVSAIYSVSDPLTPVMVSVDVFSPSVLGLISGGAGVTATLHGKVAGVQGMAQDSSGPLELVYGRVYESVAAVAGFAVSEGSSTESSYVTLHGKVARVRMYALDLGASPDFAGYAKVQASIPALISTATEDRLPSDWIDGSDAQFCWDWHVLESALLLVAVDSLACGSSADLVLVLELSAYDSLSLNDLSSIGQFVELLAMESISVSAESAITRKQALQYAVNYLTGALSTYTEFNFLGFTHRDGQSFAWRKDGLYRIGEPAPDQVVQALVDIGASDYKTSNLKRLQTAFVGVRTDGECYLRLTADDDMERVYQLVGRGEQLRANLAKGVSGHYWNLRLELTEASYAALDSLELEVAVVQRRSRR